MNFCNDINPLIIEDYALNEFKLYSTLYVNAVQHDTPLQQKKRQEIVSNKMFTLFEHNP